MFGSNIALYNSLHLSIFIKILIQNYFNTTTCLMHYHDNPEYVTHSDNIPIIQRSVANVTDFLLDNQQICKVFLLQCTDSRFAFESTEYMIKMNSSGWYNERKYIVLIENKEKLDVFFNSTILTFVRDILVIYKYSIIRYDLYTHRYVGFEDYNSRLYLDSWFATNLSFKVGSDLFPDKISDQKGRELWAPCTNLSPFAICRLDPPFGNEFNLVIKYAQRYNFTLNSYLNTNDAYGYIYANWTSEGTFSKLAVEDEDYRDMIYGGFPKRNHVDLLGTERFSYEVSVPIPNIKHGFFMFLEVFDIFVWLGCILIFLCARGIGYIIKQMQFEFDHRRNCTHISLLETWGLLINQPLVCTSRINGNKFIKFIHLLLLLSSVLLVTAYNSRLASVMVTPVFENDINSFQELAESNLKLLFFDEYFWLLKNDGRKVYHTLYEKIVLISNNTDFDLSEKLLSSRKYAVARYRRINGDYFEFSEHLKQMNERYKPIKPELFHDFYYITLRKNSVHTYVLRKLLKNAEEAGLMRFWEETALRSDGDMIFDKHMQESSVQQNVNLNFKHLKGIYLFWLFGLIISCAMFLKELWDGKNMDAKYEYNN